MKSPTRTLHLCWSRSIISAARFHWFRLEFCILPPALRYVVCDVVSASQRSVSLNPAEYRNSLYRVVSAVWRSLVYINAIRRIHTSATCIRTRICVRVCARARKITYHGGLDKKKSKSILSVNATLSQTKRRLVEESSRNCVDCSSRRHLRGTNDN